MRNRKVKLEAKLMDLGQSLPDMFLQELDITLPGGSSFGNLNWTTVRIGTKRKAMNQLYFDGLISAGNKFVDLSSSLRNLFESGLAQFV